MLGIFGDIEVSDRLGEPVFFKCDERVWKRYDWTIIALPDSRIGMRSMAEPGYPRMAKLYRAPSVEVTTSWRSLELLEYRNGRSQRHSGYKLLKIDFYK